MPVLILTTKRETWDHYGRPTALAGWDSDEPEQATGDYFLLVGGEIRSRGAFSLNASDIEVGRSIVSQLYSRWLFQNPMKAGIPTLSVELRPKDIAAEHSYPGLIEAARDVASTTTSAALRKALLDL